MSDELRHLMINAQPVHDAELQETAGPELVALAACVIDEGRESEVARQRQSSTTRRRRCRRTIGIGVAGATMLAALAGPAAAEWIALRTGVTDSMTRTEMWRMDSPDTAAALVRFTEDYPLAPGYSTRPMVEQFAQGDAEMPEVGFRQYVNLWSRCSWEQTWLEARKRGDSDGESAAARVLLGLPDRSHHPVPLYDYTDTPHEDDVRLARAVADNRPALVINDVAVNCIPVVIK